MHSRTKPLIWAGCTVGLATTTLGIVNDGQVSTADIRAIGGLLFLAGLIVALHGRAHRSESEVFERGREIGYDRGWNEGRRAGRPVVVPLPRQAVIEPTVSPLGTINDSQRTPIDARYVQDSQTTVPLAVNRPTCT